MSTNKNPSGHHAEGNVQPRFEQAIDPYRNDKKLSEPTVCKDCGAVYHQGRWQWGDAPKNAHQETCPSCRRIQDNFPAGYVTLNGSFLEAHLDEIQKLIQHHAERERAEHPLKRIMAINHQNGTIEITTTDMHLAKGLGEAIHHAYQGELKTEHTPGENLVRVSWHR